MVNRTAILISSDQAESDTIDWHKIGQVVTELSQLYHLVKESRIDLILVDENRTDLKPAVATRIRQN